MPKFDSNSFNILDESAGYFLGLLYADGCLCKTTNNRHTITFGSNDKELVSRLKKFMKSSNKIYEYQYKPCRVNYRISFCNKPLFKHLQSLGLTERKSLTIKPPKIDKHLYKPFLLGLFDGDGSISVNRSINSVKVQFSTGSFHLYKWICKVLRKDGWVFSVETRKIKSGNFYLVVLNGISAIGLLRDLYTSVEGEVKPLSRKYNKYLQYNNTQFRSGPELQPWELKYLKQNTTHKECADKINNDKRCYWSRSVDTVRHMRYYRGL